MRRAAPGPKDRKPAPSKGLRDRLRAFLWNVDGTLRWKYHAAASGESATNGNGKHHEREETFRDQEGVIAHERAEIARRRLHAYGKAANAAGAADDPVALSLSGGGIRSATFNLGLIQALHASGMFRHLDYLVT